MFKLDDIEAYTPDEVTDEMLKKITAETVTKVVRKREVRYTADFSTFDIEATNLKYCRQAVMYMWQWYIGGYLIIGRRWSEFLELFERLQDILEDKHHIIYVHNLSYEFCFLAGIMPFYRDDVFATGSHKVLYARKDNCEFRCSYKLTNMSLDLFTHEMKVKHGKLSGYKFDYSKERFPWTPLSLDEYKYGGWDVVGLYEAVHKLYDRDGDNVATVPYTSTGYVRREVKEEMEKTGEAKKLRWKSKELKEEGLRHTQKKLPDFDTQKMLRAAFRGGNTHASRWYVTRDNLQIIVPGVYSYDRSSSYPDVICNCPFPVGSWFVPRETNLNSLLNLILRGYAVVMKVYLWNVRLKHKREPVPYISVSKTDYIQWDSEVQNDNGRVLAADYIEMTITDIDYKIIDRMYDYDHIEIEKMAACKYGPLPKAVTDKVKEYYTKKTALKGNKEQEMIYAKAKALLNAIYGMMCQDPCKTLYEYDESDEFEAFEPEAAKKLREEMNNATEENLDDFEKSLTEILEKYYEDEYEGKLNYAFLSYSWGVWTSAAARYRLQEAIDEAVRQKVEVVYVDTDSIKTIGPLDLSEYNAERIADSKESGAFAVDAKGVTHYMGVFEEEPDNYGEKFVTMGAKKYAYIGKPLKISDDYKEWAKDHGYSIDGINLHITIAGVSKTAGAIEMWNKGGLESFQEGFLFEDAGGLQAVYNTREDINGMTITHEDEVLEITPNVYLEASTYKLGIAEDFARMLAGIDFACRELMKMWRIGI